MRGAIITAFTEKLAPYDANIRSPLIVSMPGTIPEGKVCRTHRRGRSAADVLSLCKALELPWKMHGHDLSPLLQQPDAVWPHTTLLPFTADKFGADCDRVPAPPAIVRKTGGTPWYVLVGRGHHKYIRTLDGPSRLEALNIPLMQRN